MLDSKKQITIKDVLLICNGKLICGEENLLCDSFSKDTRNIKQGDIYVGIKGENYNGSKFYKDALEKGAKACILEDVEIDEKTITSGKTIVIVKDTVKALQQLATYKRSLYNIPVIAVTGSAGKTSTKDMIAGVMGRKFKVLKTQGNFNNEIGVPLTILKLEEHDALILEMGMNHVGEISILTKIAKPDVVVFTNIGTAHIGLLGSRHNILKAKLEILEGLNPNGKIIINGDDDLLREWKNKNENKYFIITCGMEKQNNIFAENIKMLEKESTYTVKIEEKEQEIKVPVAGKHFIINSLLAVAVGKLFKIDPIEIAEGIRNFEFTKNRMQIEENEKGIMIINDCYNASFEAMKASIEYLETLKNRRKIAVLGEMRELGEYSKKFHEQLGECIVNNKIDLLYAIGEFANYIANKARENGMEEENIYIFKEKTDAILSLKKELKRGDAVLLKAANGMKFIEIYENIK